MSLLAQNGDVLKKIWHALVEWLSELPFIIFCMFRIPIFIKCAKIEGKTKVQTVILIFHTKCDKTKQTVHQNFLNDITACNLQILKNSRPQQSEQNNEGKSKVTLFHAI